MSINPLEERPCRKCKHIIFDMTRKKKGIPIFGRCKIDNWTVTLDTDSCRNFELKN